jgi:hypothetical protein
LKDSLVEGCEDNIFKLGILSKMIDRFSASPVTMSHGTFAEMEKPSLKLVWNGKGKRAAKTILKKQNKVEGIKTSHEEGKISFIR